MRSIHQRLWVWMTGLVLVVLLITFIVQVLLLPKLYYWQHEKNLISETEEMASTLSLGDIQKDETNYSKYKLQEFANGEMSFIAVLNLQRDLMHVNVPEVFQNRPEGQEFQARVMEMLGKETDLLYRDLQDETLIYKRFVDPMNNHIYIVSVPLKDNATITGYLVIVSPLPVIDEAVRIVAYQLIPIAVIALIIGGLLAKWASGKFTRPIHEIKNAAQKIAEGDNRVVVEIHSYDEIGELGKAINHMALRLADIQRLRRELIGNTSHELKTPIGLIKGYSMMMKEIKEESKHFDDYLDIIIDESDRLTQMIEDMLLLSRMQSFEEALHYQHFDVMELLLEVVDKLQFLIDKKQLKIRFIALASETSVEGDRTKMLQVYYNLIHNAIKFSKEEATIDIHVEKTANGIRVTIKDYGVGISEKDIRHVWTRFYKIPRTEINVQKGTGLGLSIVKTILDRHGFQYGLESRKDEGTCVWIDM